jgi:putative ABC transport system permease protein
MLKNFLKIALRSFARHKIHTFLNVAGLAAGLAAALLILLWVRYELGFDRFRVHADRLYRVLQEVKFSDHEATWAITQGPLGPGLEKDFPEIARSIRLRGRGVQVRHGEEWITETFWLTDPSIFEAFTFPLAAGDPATALADPRSIVLSEEMAEKYFPAGNALGRTIQVDGGFEFRVTGVLKPVPRNSEFRFPFLVPFVFGREIGLSVDRWNNSAFTTYVRLAEGVSAEEAGAKIAGYLADKPTVETGTRLALQPLRRVHLRSNYEFDSGHGDIRYVRIFSLAALFILLIACINFMNLTTARSAVRAREVGVRKVSGARRAEIAGQFYGESALLILAALVLALILAKLLLPAFNELAAKRLTLGPADAPGLLPGLLVLLAVTVVVAGSYPAFVLSRFQPARVLKAGPASGACGRGFRRALVVVQFSLTILLLVCTAFVRGQLDYMRSAKLGYDKENVVFATMRGDMRKNFPAVRAELERLPGVAGVAASETVPTSGYSFSNSLWTWPGQPAGSEILMRAGCVDEGYFGVLGLEIVQGRTFDGQAVSESNPLFVVNEEAARVMELKEPVGQWLSDKSARFKGTIVGLVKDYHFTALRQRIEPLILIYYPPDCDVLLARLKPGDVPRTIAAIEGIWKTFAPGFPFRLNFLDQALDDLYRSEERIGAIIRSFSLLAVAVSCLGLFGLASHTAERRTKEIGIRKVLGASGPSLAWLLAGDFSRWVLAANVLAWPAAYLAVAKWLEGYPYRIAIGPGPFLLAGGTAFLVALLTVGFHSVRSARANPAGALRYE